MTQIEALTDSPAQNDIAPNDTPDDVIDINSDVSLEEDGDSDGESGNDEDVEVESADDQDPGQHVEEMEETEGDKSLEDADVEISEVAEIPDGDSED